MENVIYAYEKNSGKCIDCDFHTQIIVVKLDDGTTHTWRAGCQCDGEWKPTKQQIDQILALL